MANAKFNICTNWGLRCYEQKFTEKSVILKCTMNSKKKDTNEYTAPLYIDVICSFEKCEIEQDDYAKSFINVDGSLMVGEFTNKNGDKTPTISIFADKVTKSTFNKK